MVSRFQTLATGALLILAVACSKGGSDSTGGATLDLSADEMNVEVAKMLSISDTLDRNRRLVQLMDALDEENVLGAAEAYEANLNRADPSETRLFANAWAKIDAHSAVERIASWRYPRITNEAVTEAVFVWALYGDPAEARAYVDPKYKGPIEARRSPSKFMVQAVLEALGVAKEWDQLTELLAQQEEEGDRELWLTQIMIEINRAHGLEGSREWIEAIPWDAPSNLKVSALKRGFTFVSSLPDETSLRWYESIEKENPRSIELLPLAVRRIVVQDPPRAATWLLERPETSTRNVILRELAKSWLQRDPPEAEAWIRSNLDNDELRGANLVPLVNSLLEQARYRDAAELAREFGLEGTQDKLVAQVLREWSTFSTSEVDAYVAEVGLSPEVVAMYEEMRSKRPMQVQRRPKTKIEEAVQ